MMSGRDQCNVAIGSIKKFAIFVKAWNELNKEKTQLFVIL